MRFDLILIISAVILNFFEVGKVFAGKSGENELPNEQELLALVLTGGEMQENRAMPVRQFDFYDAKGAIDAALDAAGAPAAEYSAVEVKHLRTGQTAAVSVGLKIVGYVGRLDDEGRQSSGA